MAMRAARIRHQLFLPQALGDRLEGPAARPGASNSSILADAATAWLNRRGASELDEMFSRRLDRLWMALGRVERDSHVALESFAIPNGLMIEAPLPEGDTRARAVGRDRFNAFVARVGEALAREHRTFEYLIPVGPDGVEAS